MPNVPINFACGVYDRMLASISPKLIGCRATCTARSRCMAIPSVMPLVRSVPIEANASGKSLDALLQPNEISAVMAAF
jgi:hypothetical protein